MFWAGGNKAKLGNGKRVREVCARGGVRERACVKERERKRKESKEAARERGGGEWEDDKKTE